MKLIPLTRGKFAKVDDADFTELSQYRWQYTQKGYAARGEYAGKKTRTVLMHREIMGLTDPLLEVDHINGDKADNRKSNLRVCTSTQNRYNRASYKNTSSRYKGVSYRKDTGKWMARLRHDNRCIYLGQYDTELKAAKAYDKVCGDYFGQFARPNFPTVAGGKNATS